MTVGGRASGCSGATLPVVAFSRSGLQGGVLAIGVLEVVHANPTGWRSTTTVGLASLDQAARLETTIGMPFFG